ncbi:hypothetical protein Ddc_14726 [Ditylenchus destructor]|nr:hypothetical protein Ddc_14726 [Ditylenchus destructor]
MCFGELPRLVLTLVPPISAFSIGPHRCRRSTADTLPDNLTCVNRSKKGSSNVRCVSSELLAHGLKVVPGSQGSSRVEMSPGVFSEPSWTLFMSSGILRALQTPPGLISARPKTWTCSFPSSTK